MGAKPSGWERAWLCLKGPGQGKGDRLGLAELSDWFATVWCRYEIVTAGRKDSNIDVVLLFLHRSRSPWISSASAIPCREEEKQETDSKMKSSQQRIETKVKKTKGAQVRREKESGKRRRGKQSTSTSFSFPLTSQSLNVPCSRTH